MKRLLSTVLSFLLIISVFVTPFNTVLAEEENSIAAVEFGNVTISNYSVAIGFSKRIYIMNSGASNEECIWTTSDESIVALAGRGRLETNEYYADISGVSEGTTTICVTLGEKTYSIVVSSYMPYEGDITGQTLAPAPIYDSAGQNKKYKFNISQGENLKIIGSCGDLYKVSFLDRTPEDSEYDAEFYTLKAAVRINITNLIFDRSSTSMNVGETKELGLTVLPKLASNAVLWFSSDSSIATVENGVVTAISPGSIAIRAYSSTNDVDAVMNISVYKAATELTYSEIPNQYFCGDFIAPDVEIKDGDKTLEKGKDFDVEYNDNYNVGTASISIYFKNYYTGTHIVNFNILEQNINSVFDIENIPDQTFTGNPLNPNPTITCGGKLMVLGEHYYLDFYNNIYTGLATVIIRGKGGFVGTIEKTFNIVPLDGNDSQIRVQVSDAVFSNENKTPLVRVWHNDNRLIKGSDYTLEYSDNIKIGMGKVTIKFIGNYSGTQTKQFYIKPPKGEFLLDGENSFDGTVNAIFLKFKSHHDDANNVKLYYELYRDGEYVSTQNSAEYDDFDLSDYEIHEYKMRMFFVDESNQKHYGEWSDTIKLGTAPNNVEIKDVKINTNNDGKTSKAVITVNGVGIHNSINVYYELWRYSANYNDIDVDWELIKSDCSTSTYTDATTVVGSRYLYEVRPYYYIENTDSNGNKYNIKIYGDLTENYFAESPLPAVTDFKVTYDARTGEAHFTWLKTVAATGYTIVAYDDDGITSTYGYDVNSTDCKYTLTCDKIVPNRIYKFRILSYNKKYDNYGNPSALVTFKSSLPKISITSLKMGSEYPLIKTDFPVSRYDLTAEYWIATSSSGPFKLSETVGANIAAVDHPLKCEYDKKYYVKVRVKYSGSSVIYGDYSDVKSIEVGPKTPTVSSIERNSADTGFNLKWTSSANAKSYLIYGSHGGGNYSQLASVSGTSTTINYSELAANAYYTFKVCAVGNYRSGLSNGAQGLTPVKSVTVSSPSEGKVNISYPGGDATSYQIGYAKDGSSYDTVTTSSTSHSFSGLTPGAKYNFYVKGFYNSIGSSLKKASCTVAKIVIEKPTGFAVEWTSYCSATLSWNEASGFKYKIQHSGSSSWIDVETPSTYAGKYAYVCLGLNENTTYTFKIKAIDSSGRESEVVTASGKTHIKKAVAYGPNGVQKNGVGYDNAKTMKQGRIGVEGINKYVNSTMRIFSNAEPEIYGNTIGETVLNKMKTESSMFLFYGHGKKEGLLTYPNEKEYSWDEDKQLKREDIEALPDNALAHVELVIYLACSTYSKEDNLGIANITKMKGAKNVICFPEEIGVEDADKWLCCFAQKMAECKDIAASIKYAKENVPGEGKYADGIKKVKLL